MGMKIIEAMGLDVGASILLDSSAVIGYLEGGERSKAAMAALVEAAGSGLVKLSASAVALTETLRGPTDAGLALAYRRFLADSTRIVVVPVDAAIAFGAAGLLSALDARNGQAAAPRETRKAGFFADAIHLATAIVNRCAAVVTNDEAWREVAPRSLRVVVLDELASAFSVLE